MVKAESTGAMGGGESRGVGRHTSQNPNQVEEVIATQERRSVTSHSRSLRLYKLIA
jgi:hypothetical protein